MKNIFDKHNIYKRPKQNTLNIEDIYLKIRFGQVGNGYLVALYDMSHGLSCIQLAAGQSFNFELSDSLRYKIKSKLCKTAEQPSLTFDCFLLSYWLCMRVSEGENVMYIRVCMRTC